MSNAPESFPVIATLAAERIVSFITTGGSQVHYPAANTEMMVGITRDTVLDTTSAIPVAINGIARCLFNQTVSSGELVTADSSGRAVVFSAVTAPTSFIGTYIGQAAAATGTVGEILINPGWKSIP